MNLKEPTNIIIEKLTGWYEAGIQSLPNLAVATVVMIAFVFIAKLVKRIASSIANRYIEDFYLNKFTKNLAYLLVIVAGAIISLNILNLDKTITSFLAGAGIIGLALGFAFQETATNFISGVFMITRKPIRRGDHIEVKGNEGIVDKVGLRTTNIETFDGNLVMVPNKDVFQGVVKNYSHKTSRRVDISCGVSYGDDLEKTIEVVNEALSTIEYRDKEKGIDVWFTEFGDSSINFSARFWLKHGEKAKYLKARSEAIIAIKKAFNEHSLDIPFPIRTIDFGIKGGQTLAEELNQIKALEQLTNNTSIRRRNGMRDHVQIG
jgi:small conductance mechanosensitive channel